MRALRFDAGDYSVEMLDEPLFTPGSRDNARSYGNAYLLSDSRWAWTSRHGLLCRRGDEVLGSVVLLAAGGASGVHERSVAVFERRLYACVGDHLVCLCLPTLDMVWKVAADHATVFGVHVSPDCRCLIAHGELDISRISLEGEVEWSAGGADIFTGDLSVEGDFVSVSDFEGRRYAFRLVDGSLK